MNTCIVLVPLTALHHDPDLNSERVDELLYGMACEALDSDPDGGWTRIRTRYGYMGWLRTDSLMTNHAIAEKWEERATAQIRLPFSDVLAEPRDGSPVLLTLPRGSEIQLLPGREGRWNRVALPDDSSGWLLTASFQTPDEVPAIGSDAWRRRVAATAMSYLGTQYRWGGKSPLGIDCSGLTQMAWGLNGVMIPRDADQQQEALAPTVREKAKPGDLLFSPGHVMLYLGDGSYVHATGREGVVLVNSLFPTHPAYREDIDRTMTGVGTLTHNAALSMIRS